MAETINSAFDVLSGLTVDEALANPHFMPELLLEELNGEEVQKMFFRDVTVNSNIIAFREALPSFLEDDVERVAEFGEIPVSDPTADARTTTRPRNSTLPACTTAPGRTVTGRFSPVIAD